MAHGDIYDGNNPKNIAGQGLIGPLDPITVASQGFITPIEDNINLVTGGAALVTTFINGTLTYYYPMCPQGFAFGGSALVTFVEAGGIETGGEGGYRIIYSYSTTGGITTGGQAAAGRSLSHIGSGGLTLGGTANIEKTFVYFPTDGLGLGGDADTNVSLSMQPSGGITLGGEAKVIEVEGEAGRGAGTIISFIPAKRKPQPTPHHFWYKADIRKPTIRFGGSAEVSFKRVIPREYTKPLQLYLQNAEIRQYDTEEEQVKTSILRNYMSKAALKKSNPVIRGHTPSDKINASFGGSATVKFFDYQQDLIVKDDALLLDLEMLQNNTRDHILNTSYTYESPQNKKDEEELLLWLT